MRGQKHKFFSSLQAGFKPFLRRTISLGLCILLSLVHVAFLFVTQPEKASASVSFVGAASDTSATNTNENSVTITIPAAVAEDDILIAFVAVSDGSALSPYISPPDVSWNEIAKSQANGISVHSFWKAATGAGGGTATFTSTGSSTRIAGGVAAYRGAFVSAPVDDTSTVATGTATSNYSAPSSSTTFSDTMIVALFANLSTNPGSFTTPSGMAERLDFATNHSSATDVNVEFTDVPQLLAGSISAKSTTVSQTGDFAAHQFVLRPADPAHLMLFWDGNTGNIPNGWSLVSAANDKYLRGETPDNYGNTGGSATHSLSVASHSHSQTTANRANDGSGPNGSLATHTHAFNVTTSNEANLPEYRNLLLIQYDGGIPEFIPKDAIAIFDSTPGIPADEISPGNPLWTQYSNQDGYFVRADSSVATGGNVNNTHQHDLTWSALGSAVGSASLAPFIFNDNTASPNHTHAGTSTTTATNGTDPCDADPVDDSCLPPYIDVLLAKINQDTQTISIGFTAMFDKNPGGGWVLRSDSSGGSANPFYQRFLKAEATYADNNGTGFGANTHQHTTATTISGAYQGGSPDSLFIGALSPAPHNHTLTANFDPSSNIPEYYNVVIAEKVNFTLENYRWFEDNNAADVTDPWSSQNLPERTAITILPAANDAPRANRELRLRIQIEVDNNDLVAGGIAFKLQYKQGTDGECDTGSWVDVGDSASGGIWRYATSSVLNGTDLSPYASEFATASDVMQLYVNNPNAGNNPYAVGVGETMEYDFHIQHNGAPGATQYSFRVVEDSGPGVLLSEYSVCPTLETFPDTDQQLRHGNYFEVGAGEGGFTWAD